MTKFSPTPKLIQVIGNFTVVFGLIGAAAGMFLGTIFFDNVTAEFLSALWRLTLFAGLAGTFVGGFLGIVVYKKGR